MNSLSGSKNKNRLRKHRRIRVKLKGTKDSPRLCLFRSLRNIFAQIIDDEEGKILLAVSSLSKEVKSKIKNGGNIETAKIVGRLLAEKAKLKKINKVLFDRAGYKYHGRVKALAEEARRGGLKF